MDKVLVTITFDPQTQKVVGMTGPLENKVLCLGILASAEKIVHDFDPAKQGQPSLLLPRINGVK